MESGPQHGVRDEINQKPVHARTFSSCLNGPRYEPGGNLAGRALLLGELRASGEPAFSRFLLLSRFLSGVLIGAEEVKRRAGHARMGEEGSRNGAVIRN